MIKLKNGHTFKDNKELQDNIKLHCCYACKYMRFNFVDSPCGECCTLFYSNRFEQSEIEDLNYERVL
jgi:hypothetical protein